MKEVYIKPVTEVVDARLLNAVLDPGLGTWSNGAGGEGEFADSRENDWDDWDDEAENIYPGSHPLWEE